MKWFLGIFNVKGQSLDLDEVHKYKELESPQNLDVEHNYIINNDSAFFTSSISGIYSDTCITRLDNYFIVGDIRIDNRNEIINRYSIGGKYIECDEMIFLYLYRKIGKSFVEKIVGEFSFIVWNKDNLELFCARDQFGAKTLFWLKEQDVIYIASDLHILGGKISISNLNESYFKDYIAFDGSVDTTNTPYKNIFRIPSAYWMLFNNNKSTVDKYWSIKNCTTKVKYKKAEDYEEQFLEIMKEAIQCRLMSERTAVLMSGGLDSPTIFALAKQLGHKNIIPISSVFDKYRETDEREFIEPILKMYSTKGVYQNCDAEIFLKNFSERSAWGDEPYGNALNHASLDKMIWSVRHIANTNNVLTGYAGDQLLNGTGLSIADQISKGKILKSIKATSQYSYGSEESYLRTLWQFGIVPNLKRIANQKISRNKPSFSQQELIKQLSGVSGRLYCDRFIARKYGVNVHAPFLDRRFVEFIYNTPGDLIWGKGVQKAILRKAMRNKLPDKVLGNYDKIGLLSSMYDGLNENWAELYPIIERGRVAEFGLIDRKEWIEIMNKWRQGWQEEDKLFSLLSLEIWLYQLEKQ